MWKKTFFGSVQDNEMPKSHDRIARNKLPRAQHGKHTLFRDGTWISTTEFDSERDNGLIRFCRK